MYNNYGGGYVNNGGYAGNGYGGSYGRYGGGDDYDDIGMDLSQTEEYTGTTLLPNGEYPVCIKKAERKNGKERPYLNVTYVVTEVPYKGCQVYESFFLWADNPEYAKQRFKALRHAIGLNPNIGGRISELPGKEFLAGIKQRQVRDRETRELTGEMENVVSAYFPLEPTMQQGASMQATQAAAPQAPQRPAQAPQHPAQAAAAPARPQPAQAPQRPAAQAAQAAQAQAQNVQPSEYAQDMSNGPAPQEATFPTPEKGSIDDTPF